MKIKGHLAILDDLDWQILELLQENAKQTYTEIGHRLDVAHSTIYDRIKRMEKQGIIKKYGVVFDLEKTGIKSITAIVTIHTEPKESENIADKLAKFSEVLETFTSFSEELVIIAKVIARDQIQLHSFIAQSIAPLPGVLRIRTSIITKKYKEEAFGVNLNYDPSKKLSRKPSF
ncbi:MAG: Lrp/AsnC family transcriptional regulator [Candidatus Bathyarchaeota archaeon]|jgi:DNA-binding Lrp family transcriptional regulator